MNFKPELVKKIRSFFNLNIYETKVWLALISKGVASAGEIAEMSGVPRSRTYDVLESLEKQGFAIAKIGKPVKYIAVKPTTVVEKLKSNALRDAEEKVKSLSTLKDTREYTELEELHKTGIVPTKQGEISSSIKGKANIYHHVREMLENSSKEIMIIETADKMEDKSRIFNGLFDRLKKANVKVKVALNGSDPQIKKINSRFGIKAIKTELSARFFISDKKQALLIVNNTSNPNEEEIALWLNSEFFVSALSYLFETAFGKGKQNEQN